jgi:D-glycero-alpha-D-manno-heptose-7-phosphate kinase
MEQCQHYNEVNHPAVREVLRFLKIDQGLEIHHDGDLPARSGMGSSSSFTVGLLHALYAHLGVMPSKKQLATESIYIEQNMIEEAVGSQDQICAAYGGLNLIKFSTNGEIDVEPVTLHVDRVEELNSHLMLFYTGIKRTASNVAKGYVENLGRKYELLKQIQEMVGQSFEILKSNSDIRGFGELLHKGWLLKKKLSSDVSNHMVDDLYERAKRAGAIGGKITGAGGGGFLLLFVPPEKQKKIRETLSEKIYVPFRFESGGSQIIFYEPEREDYSESERDRAERAITCFRELDSIGKPSNIKDIPSISKSKTYTEHVV